MNLRELNAGHRLAVKASAKGYRISWLNIYQFANESFGSVAARRMVRARIWWRAVFDELAELEEPGSRVRNKAERELFSNPPYWYDESHELDNALVRAFDKGPLKRTARGLIPCFLVEKPKGY